MPGSMADPRQRSLPSPAAPHTPVPGPVAPRRSAPNSASRGRTSPRAVDRPVAGAERPDRAGSGRSDTRFGTMNQPRKTVFRRRAAAGRLAPAMVGTRWHRLLVVLLLGLALGWPLLKPAMGTSHAAAAGLHATMTGGCNGCEREQSDHGSCPAVLCIVLPAVVPSSSLDPEVARPGGFAGADERGRGRIPETHTPPPRTSPRG
jgi:hypothetical protein